MLYAVVIKWWQYLEDVSVVVIQLLNNEAYFNQLTLDDVDVRHRRHQATQLTYRRQRQTVHQWSKLRTKLTQTATTDVELFDMSESSQTHGIIIGRNITSNISTPPTPVTAWCQTTSCHITIDWGFAQYTCRMGHFNFWLSLSISDSLSETLSWTVSER